MRLNIVGLQFFTGTGPMLTEVLMRPRFVQRVEVGRRDGLRDEAVRFPAEPTREFGKRSMRPFSR
jgi:hypothetical protein